MKINDVLNRIFAMCDERYSKRQNQFTYCHQSSNTKQVNRDRRIGLLITFRT